MHLEEYPKLKKKADDKSYDENRPATSPDRLATPIQKPAARPHSAAFRRESMVNPLNK